MVDNEKTLEAGRDTKVADVVADDKNMHPNSYLFKWIIAMQMILYMEAGAVPAILHDLTPAFSLSFADKGLLGGIVYLAISATCPIAAIAFSRGNAKLVLVVSLILNNGFVMCFGSVPQGGEWRWVLLPG